MVTHTCNDMKYCQRFFKRTSSRKDLKQLPGASRGNECSSLKLLVVDGGWPTTLANERAWHCHGQYTWYHSIAPWILYLCMLDFISYVSRLRGIIVQRTRHNREQLSRTVQTVHGAAEHVPLFKLTFILVIARVQDNSTHRQE